MKTVRSVLSGDTFKHLRRLQTQMQSMDAVVADVLETHAVDANACRIEKISHCVLYLQTDCAAVAYRVRQILPTLYDALNGAAFAVTEIQVRPNPSRANGR